MTNNQSALVVLEVYLALSLVVLVSLLYFFSKLIKENQNYRNDLSEISYWMLDHNSDLLIYFNGNEIQEKTNNDIKSYSYNKILEKARNYYIPKNHTVLEEDYDFNEVFEEA